MSNKTMDRVGFHSVQDATNWQAQAGPFKSDVRFSYVFENFFHPFVSELFEKLNQQSLEGMLDSKFHEGLATPFFDDFYAKLSNNVVEIETFDKEIDLREGGPYANYNWELLFHVPLSIAVHLSKNQRFGEAQRWFHYIFDPTCNDQTPPPKRFWKFLRFRQAGDVTQIDELLALLSKSELDASEAKLRESILRGYEEIVNKPARPHAVARTRHLAYQYCVVMKYLDNLIAWGDHLFRQDTVESINEATQRYVLAANLLGTRPQRIPRRGVVRPKTFAQLKARGLDEMGNALVELEGEISFNLDQPQTTSGDPDGAGPLFGIGRTLYFCVPRNERMLGYWDTVVDRLFKVRNCMNIEGVVRQLALFDPPIDPGMLVKAAAAGIDIGSAVSGLHQPVGPMRSPYLIQQALELCAEVRNLGAALLSAIEKQEVEKLALVRQQHEIKIQKMAKEARFVQWKQAEETTEALLKGREIALERFRFYRRLLGLEPDENAGSYGLQAEREPLTTENFDEVFKSLVETYGESVTLRGWPPPNLAGDTSPTDESLLAGQGKLYLNLNEDAELNEHIPAASGYRKTGAVVGTIHSVLGLLPLFSIKAAYWGVGPETALTGGQIFSGVGSVQSQILNTLAADEDTDAAVAAKTSLYERRAEEWTLQHNLAARELMQIGRQIIGSLIAEQVSRHEYETAQKQIEQSEEVLRVFSEKFTNEALYGWMHGEISRLYYENYRFAFDTARRAEQTTKRELMRPEVDGTDFVKFNYWDGGRKGLLSGEALYLDVKRLETAYHEHNKREYELTKHVSLRQLDPLALLALKAYGSCEVSVPEWLFDLDCPGHYMRRIKSVSLSIPSVVGPYTSINCTLSLLKSTVRRSPSLKDGEYVRAGSEDDRFADQYGAIQSVVTSSANDDTGMFETNLRDERFLPFEGAGAVSHWKLELPSDFRQFDYDSISDVIVHVRYTAREGVARTSVVDHLNALVADAEESGLSLLISLKHDFPGEWHQFLTGNGTGNFTGKVTRAHFPYVTSGRDIILDAIQLYTMERSELSSVSPGNIDSTLLAALSDDLKTGQEFELPIPTGEDILGRGDTFALIRYSLESR